MRKPKPEDPKPDPRLDAILFLLFRINRKLSRIMKQGADQSKLQEIADAVAEQRAQTEAALTRNTP